MESKIKINKNKLSNIINKLLDINLQEKKLPNIFLGTRKVYTLVTREYFILALLDSNAEQRINKFLEMGIHPFPGLIAPNYSQIQTAFKLDNIRNAIFNDNKIINQVSFKLGSDSTVIIYNHNISINDEKYESFDYKIDLLYLIGFGSQITISNFYNYLDELIEFSFTYWRSSDV